MCFLYLHSQTCWYLSLFTWNAHTHRLPNEYTYPGSSPLSSRFIDPVYSRGSIFIWMSNGHLKLNMSKTKLQTLQLPNASSAVFSHPDWWVLCIRWPLDSQSSNGPPFHWEEKVEVLLVAYNPMPTHLPLTFSAPATFLWLSWAHAHPRAFALAALSSYRSY